MAKKKIRVCCGMTCALTGSKHLMTRIEQATGVKSGEKNDEVDLSYCGCTGYCHMAPNVVVNDNFIHHAKEDSIAKDIDEISKKKPSDETNIPEATAEELLNMDFLGDL